MSAKDGVNHFISRQGGCLHHEWLGFPMFWREFQFVVNYITSIFKFFHIPCHGLQFAPAYMFFYGLQIVTFQRFSATITEKRKFVSVFKNIVKRIVTRDNIDDFLSSDTKIYKFGKAMRFAVDI